LAHPFTLAVTYGQFGKLELAGNALQELPAKFARTSPPLPRWNSKNGAKQISSNTGWTSLRKGRVWTIETVARGGEAGPTAPKVVVEKKAPLRGAGLAVCRRQPVS
jgi:hypothetical protein